MVQMLNTCKEKTGVHAHVPHYLGYRINLHYCVYCVSSARKREEDPSPYLPGGGVRCILSLPTLLVMQNHTAPRSQGIPGKTNIFPAHGNGCALLVRGEQLVISFPSFHSSAPSSLRSSFETHTQCKNLLMEIGNGLPCGC